MGLGSGSYGLGVGRRGQLHTAVNLQGPSAADFGAQQIKMLAAMHARSPPRAPIMPGSPPPKPIIEKMELPYVCRVYEKLQLTRAYVCAVGEKTEHTAGRADIGGAGCHGCPTGVGAQDKARDDEAFGFVGLLRKIDIVRAHVGVGELVVLGICSMRFAPRAAAAQRVIRKIVGRIIHSNYSWTIRVQACPGLVSIFFSF